MELIYEGNNEKRREFNEKARNYLLLYVVIGSLIYQIKTGHQSADLATGRSQPTKLERLYLESLGIDSSQIKINEKK